jgi:ribosomal protein L37AE/L43A
MGRRRLGQNKDKKVISFSIDRELIYRFDETLGDYTRSGRLEKLITEYLKGSQTKISAFARHLYVCEDCHREFHINRHVDPIVLSCSTKRAGCGSDKILYLGILGEEE